MSVGQFYDRSFWRKIDEFLQFGRRNLALIENILSNPLFWILGGILLIFLSPIFYLVYCAVCHMWFPTREPGYPFGRTPSEWYKRDEWVRQQSADDERRR